MNFKTTVISICAIYLLITLTSKNPVVNSEVADNLSILPDAETIEDTAISVSLSFADFPIFISKSQEFLCPVSDPIVTSTFGSRTHPLTDLVGFHTGIDLASNENDDVFCVLDGKIIDAGFDEIYGNYVRILHDDGYETFYAHLSEILVSDEVLQGDIIGIIGDTGMATGEHLHFEISKDGELLDPSTVIAFYEN